MSESEAHQFSGRWRGSIRSDALDEHATFVERLRSEEGLDLLRRCGLTYYALYQADHDLRIIFRSEKPSIIAGFLRNPRMWPAYWEFSSPDQTEPPSDELPLFVWARE
ncbi:MAG: hypothetical protein EXR58_06105 [Chloroflexi bacterium]|nr:hypothetical protein [Chloroflexota bacterium]